MLGCRVVCACSHNVVFAGGHVGGRLAGDLLLVLLLRRDLSGCVSGLVGLRWCLMLRGSLIGVCGLVAVVRRCWLVVGRGDSVQGEMVRVGGVWYVWGLVVRCDWGVVWLL